MIRKFGAQINFGCFRVNLICASCSRDLQLSSAYMIRDANGVRHTLRVGRAWYNAHTRTPSISI